MSMEQKLDIKIAVGDFNTFYLRLQGEDRDDEWTRLRDMLDRDLIGAFRWTAQWLDEIAYDNYSGGNRSFNPKDTSYYRGLVELKKEIDYRDLIVTGRKSVEDMTEAEKYAHNIFDSMKSWFVRELLEGTSSEEDNN